MDSLLKTKEEISCEVGVRIAKMTNNYGVLESREYKGTVNYSVNNQCWHGKIVAVDDLVTYEADSYEELVEEFKDAVLEYMDDLQWRSSPHMYILQGE